MIYTKFYTTLVVELFSRCYSYGRYFVIEQQFWNQDR